MKPYLVNLLNAIVLVVLGSWAYFASDTPSVTALIPVFAGIILIAVTPGLKRGNRIMAHVAVVLTFMILLGLTKPLTGAIQRSDDTGVVRVLIMIFTSLIALISFIRSFIKARRSSRK